MTFVVQKFQASAFKNNGFSIVELMVSILIGLIILAGVIQVVVTSRTTFFAQEDMSYIQENARYALDVLGKDIQGSGYWGCAGAGAIMALAGNVDLPSAQLMGPEPLIGFEGDQGIAGFPQVYSGEVRPVSTSVSTTTTNTPDSIITRRFAGTPFSVTSHSVSGGTLTLEAGSRYISGDYIGLVAEDCQRIGVIRAASVTAPSNAIPSIIPQVVTYTNSVCGAKIKPSLDQTIVCPIATNSFIETYLPGSVAMEYVSHAYYIATSSVSASLTDPTVGQPALKRMVLRNGKGQEEEVALGVDDLQILYGIAAVGSQITQLVTANQVAANGGWGRVVSVQVSLLFRSQTKSLPAPQQVIFLDKTYNDSYMRQVVTATYRVRNR